MHTLELILEKQKEFQKKFGYREDMTLKEKVELIEIHSKFMMEETFEMLRELPYHKPWADYSKLTESETKEKLIRAKKEFIDVFIFLSNIAIFLDIDEKDVLDLYLDKNKINIKRQDDPSLGYIAS